MKRALKIAAIVTGVIILILLFMVFSPMLFREKFASIVKTTANKELKTELNFTDLDVSFFRHFPNLTITLEDFTLRSSAPFAQDTLISARDVSFGVNLRSLFGGAVRISKVYINRGKVLMQYNEHGQSSFEVYNASADTVKTADTAESEPVSIQIDHIIFIKTDFIYSDPSIPVRVELHGINYHGISKVSDEIFRLTSRVSIDSLDAWYNQVRYLKSKPVKANLTTSINMNSLNMKFEKNNLYIKDIPFEFKGEFNFRKNGYSLFLSLFSMFGKEYISGSVYMVSEKNLWVSAKADINLDLQTWTKLLGVRDYDLRGLLSLKLNARGEYITGQNPATSKPDTVILSIPDFTFTSKLTNGYLHIAGQPEAISGMSFALDAFSRNHDYRTVSIHLEELTATFMKNKLEGYCRIDGLTDLPIDARIAALVNLEEIRRVIPLDSLDLTGLLDLTAEVKGNYAPDKHLFPAAVLKLDLKNGSIRTKHYPKPVEEINLSATVNNTTGRLSDTKVTVDPFSFTFAGNPFRLTASLANPDNLVYDITAKGSVDVAGIYHLFSREGMDLDGFASMDLRLRGRQSDAMEGRFERLQNSGQMELREISFTSEYLPLPLVIKDGIFRFENDNVWFKKFNGIYGASDIRMDGHLANVVNYVLADDQKLKGSFKFSSGYLLVDEFMSSVQQPAVDSSQSSVDSLQSPGVIVVPGNLEVKLQADVKKIRFQGLDMKNLLADVEVKEGMLLLKGMSFDVIGCKVAMDATYGSVNEKRAFFDFHVKADSFDIKRAYNEVEMFRNLLSSAGKCEGIISLEYSLKGRLDEGMNPIYPSLEGSGVIRLAKVKVMGMKLFTSMSRNLEKEDIREPDLSKVELKTSIKKNVITLEKTRMRISGFRFRVGGETNFNGQLNLKARLGLPPLGIVGIPMRILGTQENPKFKYGRGTTDEDVEETDYTDEIPPEMLEKIRNAKATDLQDEPL